MCMLNVLYDWQYLDNHDRYIHLLYPGIILVVSLKCPISPFFKLREKWFYIRYIERIFKKDYHFSSKLRKKVKIPPRRIIPDASHHGFN